MEETQQQATGTQKAQGGGSPWDKLLGQRIVVQEKGGPIARGVFASSEKGYLKLEDAEVKGRAKAANVPEIWIHYSSIAHIHAEVEVATVPK